MPRKSKNASNKKQGTEAMKYEIARELGVSMGPNTTSKENGKVGGEITKRLVEKGEKNLNKNE